ncbi:hypothetical protein NQZ79_g1563 [Umbelopsis isabellina]|nr:hypothetical protein NQZ79_g1563 [Umbelopsis isabellina]
MHRFARALLIASILLNGTLILKLVNHYTINMDKVDYVDMRMNVYVETRDCGRNFAKIQSSIPNAIAISDEPCAHKEHVFKSFVEDIGKVDGHLWYAYKYIETLKICMHGNKMLCMVLEDDIIFVHKNETTWNNIAQNTVSLAANEDSFWDCSTRGLWLSDWHEPARSLCRIYNTERLPAFIQCMEQTLRDEPTLENAAVGALITACQTNLKIQQKRFLLVNHSGQKSLLKDMKLSM